MIAILYEPEKKLKGVVLNRKDVKLQNIDEMVEEVNTGNCLLDDAQIDLLAKNVRKSFSLGDIQQRIEILKNANNKLMEG